jgi:serine/threonine protein kinase
MVMSFWLLLIVFVIIGFLALLGAAIVLVVWLTTRSPGQQRTRRRRVKGEDSAGDTVVRREAVATDLRSCPQCGGELAEDAPEGLCPQCLLLGAIDSVPPSREVPGEQTTPYSGPSSAPPIEELAGLFPQLEILELLGQGGMGAVYKARQSSLDRLVAIKILPRQTSADPAFAERFTREARALARLSHPNIVAVHDVGQAGDLYYFIMEYVDGVNLRQLMRTGMLRPEEALGIIPQICDALQYAHEEGVVHRDIKPENILLDRKGRVKIADFGLAKLVSREGLPITLTGTHQVMGTLYYMAPEQMERPQSVDHRADIYSLGVVFYELLTGELPVGHFTLPSAKTPVSADLDSIILRALEKEPDRRYQRASEVKTALETMDRGPRRSPDEPAPAPTRQRTSTEAIRARVRPPAVALLIIGILYLAMLPLFLLVSSVPLYFELNRPGQKRNVAMGADLLTLGIPQTAVPLPPLSPLLGLVGLGLSEIAILSGGSLLFGVFILIGALNMLQLRSYGWAMAGAIMAVIPCSPCWLVGLPVGIWALSILMNPGVRDAFGAGESV